MLLMVLFEGILLTAGLKKSVFFLVPRNDKLPSLVKTSMVSGTS